MTRCSQTIPTLFKENNETINMCGNMLHTHTHLIYHKRNINTTIKMTQSKAQIKTIIANQYRK